MGVKTGAEIPTTGLLYGVPCDKVDQVLQAVGPRSPSSRSAAAPDGGVRCPWSWLPLVLPAPGETESMSIALRSLGQGPP